jgi:hypothetical protein
VKLCSLDDDRTGSLAPEALGPKLTSQVASEFPDSLRLVADMKPAATNVLAGFPKE